LGYIDGLYGKYPRIDKELVLKYHDGLDCNDVLHGPPKCPANEFLEKEEEEEEEVFKWSAGHFIRRRYYIGASTHGIPRTEPRETKCC